MDAEKTIASEKKSIERQTHLEHEVDRGEALYVFIVSVPFGAVAMIAGFLSAM